MNRETDKDYEALLENYEDAMMRLVMYRIAQEDGRRLLEEAEELERSGFEVPKELDEKCLKLIEKSCASVKRKTAPVPTGAVEDDFPHHFRLHKVGQIVAAAILAAVLLFGVAYAVNDDFRVNVLNFFLELRENGTQFFFRSEGTEAIIPNTPWSSDTDKDFPFEFTYIPEGYEVFHQEEKPFGGIGILYSCRYYDPNSDGDNFYFEIGPISEGTGLFVDTEDAAITNMTINGCSGQLIQKTDPISGKEQCTYLWFDLENKQKFIYFSLGVPVNETQEIFDGIVLNGQNIEIS